MPVLSEASHLPSEASRSKGWFGASKVSWPARGKWTCPTYPSGRGGGTRTFGVGAGVLIRGGYRNRPDFRPADRLAESFAGLSANQISRPKVRRADNCAKT